eukprot:807698_1
MRFHVYIWLLVNVGNSQNTTSYVSSISPMVSHAVDSSSGRTYFPFILYIIIIATIVLSIGASFVWIRCCCNKKNESRELVHKNKMAQEKVIQNQADKNEQISINYLLENKDEVIKDKEKAIHAYQLQNKINNNALLENNKDKHNEFKVINVDNNEEVVNNYDAALNMIIDVVEYDKPKPKDSYESQNKNKQSAINYLLQNIEYKNNDNVFNVQNSEFEECKDEQKVINNMKYGAEMNMIMEVIGSYQQNATLGYQNNNEHATMNYFYNQCKNKETQDNKNEEEHKDE